MGHVLSQIPPFDSIDPLIRHAKTKKKKGDMLPPWSFTTQHVYATASHRGGSRWGGNPSCCNRDSGIRSHSIHVGVIPHTVCVHRARSFVGEKTEAERGGVSASILLVEDHFCFCS